MPYKKEFHIEAPNPIPSPKNFWMSKNFGTSEGHSSFVTSVAFSPDNETLASTSWDKTVRLWDLSRDTPKEKCTLTGHSSYVLSVAFSPDNKTLASASADGTVKLWDVSGDKPKEKCTLTGHSDWVNSVAFSPDNETLASASRDQTVKLWDVSGDKPKEKCTLRGHEGYVYSVAFSHDNKTLASGSRDCTVKLWDLSTMAEKYTLVGHTVNNPKCTCTHENPPLATTYEKSDLCPVNGHRGWVSSVAFSHDDKTIASASFDRTVKLWNLSGNTPEVKYTLEGHSRFNPECTCNNCDSCKPNINCLANGHWDEVRSVAFSSDNTTLATASSDMTVKLWDLSGDTPKEKGTLTGHEGTVRSVAFSPDNETLASGSEDFTVKLWQVFENRSQGGGEPPAKRMRQNGQRSMVTRSMKKGKKK